jgi:signal transduction histidine kinase
MQKPLIEPTSERSLAMPAPRKIIHDLRNLFGIVASAKHLLDKQPTGIRRTVLLDAIEDAAMRGSELTTELLMPAVPAARIKRTDINKQLRGLLPMIRALAVGKTEIVFDLRPGAGSVRLCPSDFDAAILELVANAHAAGAQHIIVRSHRAGTHVWVSVADTGRGMDAMALAVARRGIDGRKANGTGLCRVHQFVRAARGRFHIRSRPGIGTVMSMNLPTVLKLAASEPAAFSATAPRPMEKSDEDRQPVTA